MKSVLLYLHLSLSISFPEHRCDKATFKLNTFTLPYPELKLKGKTICKSSFGTPQSILRIKPLMYADRLLSKATTATPSNMTMPNDLLHVFD